MKGGPHTPGANQDATSADSAEHHCRNSLLTEPVDSLTSALPADSSLSRGAPDPTDEVAAQELEGEQAMPVAKQLAEQEEEEPMDVQETEKEELEEPQSMQIESLEQAEGRAMQVECMQDADQQPVQEPPPAVQEQEAEPVIEAAQHDQVPKQGALGEECLHLQDEEMDCGQTDTLTPSKSAAQGHILPR